MLEMMFPMLVVMEEMAKSVLWLGDECWLMHNWHLRRRQRYCIAIVYLWDVLIRKMFLISRGRCATSIPIYCTHLTM